MINSLTAYLVGGAVRDLLLGDVPSDRDYLVIGATPEKMLELGYQQVGADFPVFLHPITGEEYALARTERRTGTGYGGFTTEHEGVTLVQDLSRRDLTCNAIAMDPSTGELVDPFNGRADIEAKTLRHVSLAFREDPVRVLRVARLASKLRFSIAPETAVLCRTMVASGELDHLTAERVRMEMVKALMLPKPSRFFTALDEIGALQRLFPEIHALKGQTQPVSHHAEGDAFVHTMMVTDAMHELASANALSGALGGRNGQTVDLPQNVYAALCHDLGKGLTPAELLPRHIGHEEAGVPLVKAMSQRLKIPSAYERSAIKAARFHGHVHKAHELNARTYRRMFDELGGNTQLADMELLARVALADERGRICERASPYQSHTTFLRVMSAISTARLRDAFSPVQIRSMRPEQLKHAQISLRTRAATAALRTA